MRARDRQTDRDNTRNHDYISRSSHSEGLKKRTGESQEEKLERDVERK